MTEGEPDATRRKSFLTLIATCQSMHDMVDSIAEDPETLHEVIGDLEAELERQMTGRVLKRRDRG